MSTYLSLNVHIIFATKGRVAMIEDAWRADLHAYIGGTLRGLNVRPMAVGGVTDHVHLLVGMKADQPVSDLVRELKKATHVWAAARSGDFAWQRGYAALSVGHRDPMNHLQGRSLIPRWNLVHQG